MVAVGVVALGSEASDEGASTSWSLNIGLYVHSASPALVYGSTMASGFSMLLLLTVNPHPSLSSSFHNALRDNEKSYGLLSGLQEI